MPIKVYEALSVGFRSEKHKAQWKSSLATYAAPLRDYAGRRHRHPGRAGRSSNQSGPQRPVTALRVRGRIEKVLDAAKAKGFREGENPARWRGHLDHLLSRPRRNWRAGITPQCLTTNVCRVCRRTLRGARGSSPRWPLKCASSLPRAPAKSSACAGGEIDLDKKVWTVPAHRMKAGREHRVPLSQRAHRLSCVRLGEGSARATSYFPGQRSRQTAVGQGDGIDAPPDENRKCHGRTASAPASATGG